jgi:hypothetical protein
MRVALAFLAELRRRISKFAGRDASASVPAASFGKYAQRPSGINTNNWRQIGAVVAALILRPSENDSGNFRPIGGSDRRRDGIVD